MARPTTKHDLVQQSEEKFQELLTLVETLTKEQQAAPFNFSETLLEKKKEAHWRRDKNIHDVYVHLYEWHQLLLNWVKKNQEGQLTSFLPEPYNWRTYGELNQQFVKNNEKNL